MKALFSLAAAVTLAACGAKPQAPTSLKASGGASGAVTPGAVVVLEDTAAVRADLAQLNEALAMPLFTNLLQRGAVIDQSWESLGMVHGFVHCELPTAPSSCASVLASIASMPGVAFAELENVVSIPGSEPTTGSFDQDISLARGVIVGLTDQAKVQHAAALSALAAANETATIQKLKNAGLAVTRGLEAISMATGYLNALTQYEAQATLNQLSQLPGVSSAEFDYVASIGI